MFCSDAIPCAYLQPYRSGSTAHDRCTRGWQPATACPRAAAEVRSATLYVYVPHAMPAFVVSKVRLVCPHLQAYSQLTVLQRTLYSDHGTRRASQVRA